MAMLNEKSDRMPPELEIRHLSKSFDGRKVLDDVSLKVEKGDIYGILGLSGAGKSTLVRCINGLESYEEGEILFEGRELSSPKKRISKEDLRNIGMIFQSFNLMEQKTVLRNVELALEINPEPLREKEAELEKEGKKESRGKLKEKLALHALKEVGLEEKKDDYPSQLSGGQKQRVAIARTLVLSPRVILSDEATSALDPETTNAVLALLKDLSLRHHITVIMISHQLNAIEAICNKVSIIDHSRIVEEGSLSEVFLSPKDEITKKLIYANHIATSLSEKRFIRILFDGNTDEPLISNIVENLHVRVSIVYADTKVNRGKAYGQTIIKRPVEEKDAQKIFDYLAYRHIRYEEVNDDVRR